ncbi:insecticidal toxin complex protein [Rhodohalobacter sp. SW132]|uniref:SpvB/TcaC N-terminal domain-containing protein n=1 Tax=Rhodohalobacter sp. SW132 TaxID=2293433 RepID=UPI000E25ACCF|nr:SpvB/TcaC N-terminal domain-containing protein [Rhodohalobacter sp. SW132]REL37866.1 insecticidal toxin complex protein [Rhodohalobacter sp. SW132]
MQNIKDNKKGDIADLTQEQATDSNAIEIPELSLPKGGGALKSIDEKFEVNAANGTASFSIPLPITPGRNGFAPSLSLSYNSGGGNSPFGVGWSLSYPMIQCRTDKRLPQYQDSTDEDTFMFSGAEDLVPYLEVPNEGEENWKRREHSTDAVIVHQYRPRVEGGFTRIERITRKVDGQVYWKVTTRENVTTFLGLSPNARIFDPEDESKIYSWLPEFSYDGKGNWMRYEYKAENLAHVPNDVHERNRHAGIAKFTNRYLKRVKYGNRTPWYADDPFNPTLPDTDAEYFFEVVMDYGDHKDPGNSEQTPTYEESRPWESRPDAFSSYRSGFEIRTYRRCFNILMFHHFPDEVQFEDTTDEGTTDGEPFGSNYLVKSLALSYQPSSINESGQTEVSYLQSVTQKGFIQKADTYFEKSLPPTEFEYQNLQWNTEARVVDSDSIMNAPVGLTNNYQWVDLYGEGINGILTEQAEGWYYKSNLGDIDEDRQVRFTKANKVIPKPSFSGLSNGVLSIQDLESNGQKQVVVNSPGMQGYFELTEGDDFKSFEPFEQVANVNLQDPNTRLLDLNGDGQPEIVMTEDNLFTWHPADGKKGYKRAESSSKTIDEEKGPAFVFADTDQQESIFLADMSGDGLTDIVRVRDGEICYWANKGYGRFSAKINMGNAPHFDHPDQFNPKYLQLSDISGTGASDIIYLGRNKFKAYINLTGNAWSEAHQIEPFFPIDSNTQLSVIDLLGTGTSCIVWSSDLPAESHAPMRYMDLMDSKKPHVLKKYVNNFGKETSLEYKSSTHFYLKDKQEGRPWITKLPFPVQVVAKSITEDKITDVRFTAEYCYHHGYYDHQEREFRGFGMVEQRDTEEYEHWKANNEGNQLEKSEELYQAPTLTKTWFHTGAFLDRENILTQFKEEYWFEEYNNVFPDAPITVSEPELEDARIVANQTLEDRFDITELSAEEYREALRACKGMTLRQEVFALDTPSEDPSLEEQQKELKPYSVATHNCHIQLLQPRGENRYGSFIVTESEALTIHYERDETDPRIAHTLNTKIDELGNILESASVVYPRIRINDSLATVINSASAMTYERPEEKQAYMDSLEFVKTEQEKTLITYSKNIFTGDIIEDEIYRLRQPAETKTYEITSLDLLNELYEVDEFAGIFEDPDGEIDYHKSPDPSSERHQYRLIEHIRSLYYDEQLVDALPLGQLSTHGISYESYQLAYTPDLLDNIFTDEDGTNNRLPSDLDALLSDEGKFVHSEDENNWWIRSGRPLFIRPEEGEDITTVKNRFFSPIAYLSPFDSVTSVSYYKDYFLMLKETEDALENRMAVERFNFRTLAPIRMKDINDNISEILVDELGLVKAMAVLGKGDEADTLDGLAEYTTEDERNDIENYFTFANTNDLRTTARNLLQGATSRFVYNFHRYLSSVQLLEEQLTENPETGECAMVKFLPTVVGSINREQHHSNNPNSPLQLGFEYSDGMGNVAMAKAQAEPGEALKLNIQEDCSYTLERDDTGDNLRWIGNGRTVLNNKGNPVKQYEPYFSVNPFYEDNKELVERGFTPIIYYDAMGRYIRTELPDGSFTKVEFDSWQQASYDQNDTVMDSQWYDDRFNRRIDAELTEAGKDPIKEKKAAEKAAKHHNTPTVLHFDTLGRPIVSVAHNRIEENDPNGNVIDTRDEFYSTLINRDIEGNVRSVVDARNNTVMEYKYDMLGHRVYQNSMDAGRRWTLNNVAGNPVRNWDDMDHHFTTSYDVLQRPMEKQLQILSEDANVHVIEKIIYGESQADAKLKNLRGQVYQHYDSSGRMTNLQFDYKGNLLEAKRRLAATYDEEIIDWSDGSPTNRLDEEVFTSITEYDAMNRMTRLYNWHRSVDRVAVYEPSYNDRGTLEAEDHITAAQRISDGYTDGRRITAVSGIQYNEKGQRTRMLFGNGTATRYLYDSQTFRLIQLRTTKNPTNEALPTGPSNLSDPNTLQNLYYTYDPVGNISEIKDDAYKPVFFDNQRVEPKSRYTYDPLYRLIRAEGRENISFDNAPGPKEPDPFSTNNFPITDQTLRKYTQTYEYDSVGNILKMRHINSVERWTRNYKYDTNNNRLDRTWKKSDTASAVVYQNDAHGNMLNYNNTPEEYRPNWDYRDRMHHLNLGGGGEAYYQYGGNRERSRKRVERRDGMTEERLYLGGMEVYRRWNGTTLTEEIETHHLMVDDQRVLMVEDIIETDSNNLSTGILDRYQYSNHLGSVGLEMTGTGAIISYEEYHPFGTVAYQAVNSTIKATAKRYRYTGMERDKESGLNYHSARYYMPWLGRWISADPIGVIGGINLYRLGLNNPIKFKDVNGNQPYDIGGMSLDEMREERGRQKKQVEAEEKLRRKKGNEKLNHSAPYRGSTPEQLKSYENVQGDHVIPHTLRDAQRTSPSGERYHKSRYGEEVMMVETGKAEGGKPAKPHTQVKRTQMELADRVKRGESISEGEIKHSMQRAYSEVEGVDFDKQEVDRTLIDSENNLHRPIKETGKELIDEGLVTQNDLNDYSENTKKSLSPKKGNQVNKITSDAVEVVKKTGKEVMTVAEPLKKVASKAGPIGTAAEVLNLVDADTTEAQVQATSDLGADLVGYAGPVGAVGSLAYSGTRMVDDAVGSATGKSISSRIGEAAANNKITGWLGRKLVGLD